MVKKRKSDVSETQFEISEGNIFADIGIANPEEELTKAELSWEIDHIIKKRKLTQAEAAKIMGINQPKVSALLRRRLSGFSVERLMHFLNLLGQDIDIVVKPKPCDRESARVMVFYSERSVETIGAPLLDVTSKNTNASLGRAHSPR